MAEQTILDYVLGVLRITMEVYDDYTRFIILVIGRYYVVFHDFIRFRRLMIAFFTTWDGGITSIPLFSQGKSLRMSWDLSLNTNSPYVSFKRSVFRAVTLGYEEFGR